MMIKRMKYWYPFGWYVSSDEKRRVSLYEKTR
jgi:hypothetical protein